VTTIAVAKAVHINREKTEFYIYLYTYIEVSIDGSIGSEGIEHCQGYDAIAVAKRHYKNNKKRDY